ncbi:MAG: type II secretion system F family protein [Candidatus Marsarchaeota archaeon]|jgi:pilus assembly protein TadC|nr:type II secretion system F family protein [Candidatus Marsarchaeota archaeon]
MAVVFERLVSRNLVRFISSELDLAGIKMSVDAFIRIAIVGSFAVLVLVSFGLVLYFGTGVTALASVAGLSAAAMYGVVLYAVLEYMIDKRKVFVDDILPDYLQLTSANIRSGIALDKALIGAARPEFKYFRDDVLLMGKQLYAGETMQNALSALAGRYKSVQLKRTTRMMVEALRYGGGMSDILAQLAKDLRSQNTMHKEVAGQLFMYTIFIVFASVVGAPVLYGLTNKMISITDGIWGSILATSPGALNTFSQSSTISFLKPHPPTILPGQYYIFSIIAIIVISGMSAIIVSAITFNGAVRGLRNVPIYIILALAIFYVVSFVIGNLFSAVIVK